MVSASSIKDFEELKDIYSTKWKDITDSKILYKLEKTLNKVNLSFDSEQKKIIIKDLIR